MSPSLSPSENSEEIVGGGGDGTGDKTKGVLPWWVWLLLAGLVLLILYLLYQNRQERLKNAAVEASRREGEGNGEGMAVMAVGMTDLVGDEEGETEVTGTGREGTVGAGQILGGEEAHTSATGDLPGTAVEAEKTGGGRGVDIQAEDVPNIGSTPQQSSTSSSAGGAAKLSVGVTLGGVTGGEGSLGQAAGSPIAEKHFFTPGPD